MLIIGVGNEERQDDGVGLLVARNLKPMKGVTVAESSGEITQLMELWEGSSHVIAIDALSSGGAAGTIMRFEAHREPLPTEEFHSSTHSFSLPEAIELARAMGQLPEWFLVYGIEGSIFAMGRELSPQLEKAKTALTEEITALCMKHHS
jgi:hydrogenase maturation protease